MSEGPKTMNTSKQEESSAAEIQAVSVLTPRNILKEKAKATWVLVEVVGGVRT